MYAWAPVSVWSLLLPFLVVAALLLLKVNRVPQAWWIWAPIGCALALAVFAESLLSFLPSEPREMVVASLKSAMLGAVAVWLLSPYVARGNRFLTGLGMLFVLEVFGLLVLASQLEWDEGWFSHIPYVITLAVLMLVQALAFTLAGLMCRRRYSAPRFMVWLAVWSTGLCVLGMLPFLVVSIVASGSAEVLPLVMGALVSVAICVGALLPVLLLSFASGYYHVRLKQLLHVAEPVPAPASPPPLNEVEIAHPQSDAVAPPALGDFH